jgi:ribose transport system substrate-binding protein
MTRNLLPAAIVVLASLGVAMEAAAQDRWRIGFSQVTTAEPWRVLFNREMRAEASLHPDLELIIADGQDRTEKQVADVRNFIRQRLDVILISPKETAGLTGVVDEAVDAGIPVLVLDRGVATDRYTQFIGSDNLKIGQAAGEYATQLLGGAEQARGRIVEIWGGMGSTPAQERHQGFHNIISRESGVVQLVDRQDGDWKQDKAYNIMANALKVHADIDLVYAHNDPMAFGAYLAAKDAGRAEDIKFLGIDGIPEEGVMWVYKGFLTATFLYKTPGKEAIRQARALLRGEQISRDIELGTAVIDQSNAADILQQHGLLPAGETRSRD